LRFQLDEFDLVDHHAFAIERGLQLPQRLAARRQRVSDATRHGQVQTQADRTETRARRLSYQRIGRHCACSLIFVIVRRGG